MPLSPTLESMATPTANAVCGSARPSSEAVTLRPATKADAEALALVGAATFLEAFTWMLPGSDIIAHAARHHTAAAYRAYFAHPDTRITLAEAAPGGIPR